MNKTSACLTHLKQTKQTTLVIDMFNMSLKDQDHVLNELSQLEHIHSIYIQGTSPEHDDDRQYFFSKIGDMYIEKGNKDKAQAYFSQGVALYKRLSTFLNEKRHDK